MTTDTRSSQPEHTHRDATNPGEPPGPSAWPRKRPPAAAATGSYRYRPRGTRQAPRPPLPRELSARARRGELPEPCSDTASAEAAAAKDPHMPLSPTTESVLRILLDGDLSRLRAESVAEQLGISSTTLRRRLREDHTSYQFLLDRARQYRCDALLRERWLPGKCLADELGYVEVNSFYRAFRRWTGRNFSRYRQEYG